MDYSKVYFGKDLNDLVYEDIVNFFVEEKQENGTIEFKSFHPQSSFILNIGNIIKGISAFLNSSGGILIWGAPSGKKLENKKEKIFIGELAPLNILKEKDSLINLISGQITPLPIGINVKILEDGDNYLYIFEIEESAYKPHQFDDKYFVRLDGQSKPAPHYLIDALFKKITYPDLNCFIRFEHFHFSGRFYHLNFSVIMANFSRYQNEELAAFQLVLYPGRIIVDQREYWGEYYSNPHDVLHYGRPTRDNMQIIIPQEDLEKHDYKVKFSINVGGKYSPAKTSNYTLDLNGAQATEHGKNANNLIVEIEENILFSDYQDRIGKSKDTFIKDIVGR